MTNPKLLFLSILFLFQTISSQNNSLRFRNISIKDGLSDFFVYTVLEDKNGLLWVGTQEGLNRYDGNEFIVFSKDLINKNSISNNFVFALEEDSEGKIWIGTSNGLNSYNPKLKEFKQYFHESSKENSISNNWIESLLFDSVRNCLWIGAYGGLNQLDLSNNSIKRIWPRENGKKIEYTVLSLSIIEETLYFGTKGSGLYSLNLNKKDSIKNIINRSFDIRALAHHKEILFVGTFLNGLYKYDTKTKKLNKVETNIANKNNLSESIRSLLIDHNKIFIGTDGFGLIVYDPLSKKSEFYQKKESKRHGLTDNNINRIINLKSGLIALASRDGFCLLDNYEKPFKRISINSDPFKLTNYNIRTITTESPNNLWLGTHYDGAFKINLNTKKKLHFNERNGLSSNFVRVIFHDSKNQVWLGTYNGLNKYLPSTNKFTRYFQTKNTKHSLSNNFVSSIVEDGNKKLWIATEYGYSILDLETEKIQSYKLGNKQLAENDLRFVFIDRDEEIWLGSWDGLHRLNPKTNKKTVYRNEKSNLNSLSANTIFAINEDKHGNIWIGTAGGGLNIYNKKTNSFTHFNKSSGLSGNTIHSILFDKKNHAWISTYKDGINKLCLSKEFEIEDIKIYTALDGLHDNSFHPLSYHKTKENTLYFGGPKGFSFFNPDSIKDFNITNSIYFTRFRLFNHDVAIKNNYNSDTEDFLLDNSIQYQNAVHLDYNKNFFSIDFSAVEYRAAEKINYKYKLDGFESDWVESGNRTYANYTDIKPGRYRFLVKSTNKDGVWLNNQRELLIVISPPFWQRWWFLATMILLFFALFYSIHIYRLRQLQKIDKMKTKISFGLHDELASNLSSIIMFSSFIDSEKQNKNSNILLKKKISDLALESVESVKDLIWMIDDKKETLDEFFTRFKKQLNENCRLNHIECDYSQEISQEILSKQLNLELRDNLWFLLKEAATNIFKHAKAKNISCNITHSGKQLMIKIKDNGVGFEKDEHSEGRGLTIMKKRADQLSGQLSIQSELTVGTKTSISIYL